MKRPPQPRRDRGLQPLQPSQLRAAHGGFSIGALITEAIEAAKEQKYLEVELENVQVTSY
jgi:hypothetical protein